MSCTYNDNVICNSSHVIWENTQRVLLIYVMNLLNTEPCQDIKVGAKLFEVLTCLEDWRFQLLSIMVLYK